MKKLFISLAVMGVALGAQGASPKWLRNTAISPDGTSIAFTYGGDIFIVPSTGGAARQLTAGSAYDTRPIWSPDSKSIAFASDREGSSDLYIVPTAGGTPTRLTTWSGTETPLAFINDSTIIFQTNDLTSQQTSRFPTRLTRVYSVATTPGARPVLFDVTPMGAVSVGKDGKILYEDKKGLENIYRKHERSSGTSDIWLLDDGKYTKLTNFNGHDLNPVYPAATASSTSASRTAHSTSTPPTSPAHLASSPTSPSIPCARSQWPTTEKWLSRGTATSTLSPKALSLRNLTSQSKPTSTSTMP